MGTSKQEAGASLATVPVAGAESATTPAVRHALQIGDIEPEHLAVEIEYYQTTIQIQLHYNEMLIRVRSFGLTGVATLLAVAGGAASGGGSGSDKVWVELVGGRSMQVSGAFALSALLLCAGLFLLDRFYYYRLFMAAVKNCISYEIDNVSALRTIGVRRDPMVLHFVKNVPKAWSDVFVLVFWLVPMLISAVFIVAAFR